MPDRWKVLVISDTHNRTDRAEKVITELQDHIDAVYFLGDYLEDGERLARKYPRLAFLCVAGNCDFTSRNPSFEVNVAGHKLFLCHGHRYGVKDGYDSIRSVGIAGGYDVVLFGHTHIPFAQDEEELLLLNPGSIGMPFAIYGSDYAVLNLVAGQKPSYRLGDSGKSTDDIIAFLEENE